MIAQALPCPRENHPNLVARAEGEVRQQKQVVGVLTMRRKFSASEIFSCPAANAKQYIF